MSDAAVVIGATGGLGEAVLLRLAAKRPVVIGYHRNKDKAAALLARITAGGGAAWTVQVDISHPNSVAAFFEEAGRKAGGIGHVVSVTDRQFRFARCPR